MREGQCPAGLGLGGSRAGGPQAGSTREPAVPEVPGSWASVERRGTARTMLGRQRSGWAVPLVPGTAQVCSLEEPWLQVWPQEAAPGPLRARACPPPQLALCGAVPHGSLPAPLMAAPAPGPGACARRAMGSPCSLSKHMSCMWMACADPQRHGYHPPSWDSGWSEASWGKILGFP